MESTKQETLFEVAEIQLTYKSKVKPSLRPKISCSRDCENILRKYWDEDRIEFVEQFKVLLLNRAHKVLGLYEVSTGTTAHTVADPRLIFVAAIKANACAVILAHNHPSGNLNPSQADMDLTKKMKEAGRFLEVSVLDHIILTTEAYFSFADEGLL
ncbi:MAG TPA: JAB domain-containing protein [Cyclobacteriaceae bacterium]|nr:JAB domain-containing protein [Cyclobacteriaceae bacterium]